MSFSFTEAQWESLGRALARLGGEPLDWVRERLEADIDRIFARQNFDEQRTALYERVSAAAHELSDALEQLAEIGKAEAEQDELLREWILHSDVQAKLRFAKHIRQYAEGADWTLEKGVRTHGETTRGRPTDTSLLSWSRAVLSVARAERWTTEDERGRTSAPFMDLLTELAGCARAVGLDHTRDVRRALTRAIAMARVEEAEELRNKPRLNEALDAIALPKQKKAAANSNCLCSAPPKSD